MTEWKIVHRIPVFLSVLLSFQLSVAQTTEDFEDEMLGDSPDLFSLPWSGNTSLFILVDEDGDNQLRSNAGDLGSPMDYYISIPSTDISDFTWEFFIDLKFNPSGVNYVDFFLVSDDSDLTLVQNGYYVRIGDSEDWIAFHKIVGGIRTPDASPLISTTMDVLNNSSSKPFKIRVTRDGSGNWELLTDANVTGTFTSEGVVNDTDVTSSTHFGIFIAQSAAASPADGHFFDDITITSNSTPDLDPPTIQSVTAISDTEVDVLFNENVDQAIAETSTNYSIDGSLSVYSALRDETNSALVHLTTGSMSNGTTYTITINNIQDESSNVIAANSKDTYQYLVFEEAVEFDVVINEFMADPNPVIGLPNAEYVELYNRSDKFLDLENWKLDGQTLATHRFDPDSYVIICEDDDLALFSAFSNVLTVTTLTLSNSSADVITIEDDNTIRIHSISFHGSTGGTSTELINPNGPDYSKNSYGLSRDPAGGTPGEQNSIFDDTPDTTLPTITSISVVSVTELDVTFDEPVDETTSEVTSNYSVDGSITVIGAMQDKDNNSIVHLTVSTLVSGETRTLTINNVEDLSGNVIVANSTIDFEYIETEMAIAGDVLVNEFYAIPNGESSIPNAEFVELLNVSKKFIDLGNWTFSDVSDASGAFPSHILRPGEYVILVSTGEGSLFTSFGDVLEVPSFRSLNNGGDAITITNAGMADIFTISYTSATSGVSTELINPDGPDFSENNYGLSTDSDGGTPGEENSIFDDTPDTTTPKISGITVISVTELDVIFDEPVDKITSEVVSNYSVDGSITVSSALRDEKDNFIVHLTVSALVSGETRTLRINDVEDLSGNVIAANSIIDFEYIETEVAIAGDVLVNEFYAIPDADSGIPNTEYVELLNVSSKFIDLGNWTMSDAASTSGAFPTHILRPDEYVILVSKGEGSLFASFGDALEVSSFPSLNNGGDAITITNASAVDIFTISYTSATSGVSTELINPNGPDFSENNFGPSTDPDGGTPGEQNSIFDDTPDTTLPTISNIEVVSPTELQLTFSEPVTSSTAENVANYEIDGGITINSVQFVTGSSSMVTLVVSPLVSTENRTLTIVNIQDFSGNTIETGSSIPFVFIETQPAEFGDIIVNEFMANPLSEGGTSNGEFIELLNNSQKYIDLENWTFSDASGSSANFTSKILAPGELLIVTSTNNPEIFVGLGEVLVVTGFRSLNNSSDDIIIKDETDALIFDLTYNTSVLGRSAELVNPDDPCISESSYSSSLADTGSTPGGENSVLDLTPDTIAPEILSSNFEESLTVYFSETMDAASLIDGTYEISDLTIDNVSTEEFPSSVDLFFMENLQEGAIYELVISDVADCWGNILQETQVTFGIGRSPSFNEVLITEIFSDPDPSVGLPDVEFVEIYNNTSELLSTQNLYFSDPSTQALLPAVTLSPFEYCVVTTTTNVALFPGVKVIGVSGFPSLSNSGEQLYLSREDKLIFSVKYDKSWHDEEKSDGGYSLEMKDINSPCVEVFNWGSSVDRDGGTPGSPNSDAQAVPDNFGPRIIELSAVSEREIIITFDENIQPASANLGSISFMPTLTIESVDFNYQHPKSIFVTLSEDLQESNPYTVQLENITDCNGNEVQESSLVLALPSSAVIGDILLSEVLFNPRTNGVDFVELHNSSTKYLNLLGWRFARITEKGVSDEKEISSISLVMRPREYLAFTTDTEILFNNYPKATSKNFRPVSSLPTYANDSGNVVLLNHLGEVQELFHYEDGFHYNLLESDDGVSLERISFEAETNDPNNWRSASSVIGFATPGGPNSQAISEVATAVGEVEAKPKVFIPGNSGSGRDFTTINYQFGQPGKFANITIYDKTGRLIKNVAEGALLETSGFVRWDGTTNSGEMARLGYYVVLFEVFDSSGNSDIIKETVVVGRDF